MTREARAGPSPDAIRASGEGHAGGDVVRREDENDEGHPSSEGSDSRRRITTKREPREVRDERPSTTEQHVPRRILGKTTPREQAVAVTTQEALDGSREETMRIANVEDSALSWVSISSAGAFDMTHCDFSVKSAWDDTSLEAAMSSLGLTRIRIGSELYEARGRYFVHELTSEVNSRVRCMAKVMATPGIRTAVADLRMFRLAACDEGGSGFVNVSVRTITNARRVGLRLQNKCRSMRRHAKVGGTNRIMGSPSCSSNGGTVERGPAGARMSVNLRGRWKMLRGYAGLSMKTTRTRD